MTLSRLIAFVVTIYVVIVIPGPSVLFVVSRGISLGRRAALLSVAGNTTGLCMQLALVAVGVGSIVAHSAAVFTVLKLLGAAYLVVLGVRKIRHRHELSQLLQAGAMPTRSARASVREGFVVGVTNPKGFVMFTVILPQFIDRASGHVTLQLALLGAICVLIGLLSDCAWAVAAGSARQWLGSSSRRLEQLSVAGGVMLVCLGLGLAVTGRRS